MDGPERISLKIACGWLILSVFSLVFAGIFALLVALARTPVIEKMLPLGRDYIYVALVGHVVLAVVIWFLAFEGFLWVFSSTVLIKKKVFSPALGWVALFFSGAGMALVVVSAVFGLGPAELANYVPVLFTPVFYAGLILFASGIVLNLVNTFATLLICKQEGALPAVTFGMAASGVTVAAAFACIALSGWFQYSTGKMYLDFERPYTPVREHHGHDSCLALSFAPGIGERAPFACCVKGALRPLPCIRNTVARHILYP
jgi:cytochrome c oxidase subunit 1